MSRNAESRFNLAPTIGHSRSTFNRDHVIKGSSSVGLWQPFEVCEILPGDTFQIRTTSLIRFTPMVSCPMDDLYQDIYWFFVPSRLLWSDWVHFFGQDDTSAWTTPPTYKVPTITAPSGGWQNGTIADALGIPTLVDGIKVNALPFRGLALIYDEFFRDENVQDHINCPTDGINRTGVNTGNYVTDICLGGKIPKANKLHDYFSSVLPKTQKSMEPATVSLGSEQLKIVTGAVYDVPTTTPSLHYKAENAPTAGTFYDAALYGEADGTLRAVRSSSGISGFSSGGKIWPDNLYVDGGAVVSIPELRTAFQIQRFLEQQARSGSRYVEILKGFYNVTNPDYRLQRPEYLGGSRNMINVSTVLSQNAPQTGSSTEQPLGTVAGYSATANSDGHFIKSFTEHGYLFGIMTLRYKHSFQNGLAKMWTRGQDRTDYYLPVFANISEQPVMSYELYCDGSAADQNVFGYQEPWADYRMAVNSITGLMRSNANSGLDIWHFADNYNTRPTLSDTWMFEDSSNVDRCLAVSEATAGFQYYYDILVNNRATRCMPMYSVPGLIDHN